MGFVTASIPDDWPANNIECQLENIMNQIDNFIEDPSYKNKEILVALTTNYDLNQTSYLGLFRTTEYEIACINSLYYKASMISCTGLKAFLYDLIGKKARMQKIVLWMPDIDISYNDQAFSGLAESLKLYYLAYSRFTIDKDKLFSEKLIDIVKEFMDYSKHNDSQEEYKELINTLTHAYITLLNDISNFRCTKLTQIWAFSHEEIFKLYDFAAELISLNNDNPMERPLKGVLMLSISSYILKSRNGYNEDYIYKYISPEVAIQSINNHEIWMSVIDKLNDSREQKVVEELFNEGEWITYKWANNIDFKATRTYYVSSFSKSKMDESMIQKYGSCIYGYKDDRMVELLSPILIMEGKNYSHIPMFGQVVAFDILYDKEVAKEELTFLCKIIDCFNIEDDQKRQFLEEILQYWILSVKDADWQNERERRYVIFMYDSYVYVDADITDVDYLKLKTTLFIEPDFILGDNPVKNYIKEMVDDKRKAIYVKPYMFCRDCLNRDFDIVSGLNHTDECPICKSKNISVENSNN